MVYRSFAAVAVVLLPALTGCPNPASGIFTLSGSWTGNSECVTSIAFNDNDPAVTTATRSTTVTFGNDGRPANLPLLAAAFTAAAQLDIFIPGQTKTYESTTTINGATFTSRYEVTVEEASFSTDGFRVVYGFDAEIDGVTVDQTGTGSATFEGTVTDTGLDYTSEQVYELTQIVNNVIFNQDISVNCSGTLTPQ